MTTKRRGFAAIAWGLALLASVSLASSGLAAGESLSVPALQRLIRERLDAYARRDAAGWAGYVDEEGLGGGATKAAVRQAISSRPSSVKNWYGDISGLTVRVHGDVAMARYRVTEFTEIGGHRIELDEWRTETYIHRGAAWKLIGGADVVVPRDPAIARIDARAYDSYLGRYEYAPGLIDTVTREGDRLFVQSTGQEKEELFPESDTTFFAKGQDWRVVFERGGHGAASFLRFRQNGQDLVARRVQSAPVGDQPVRKENP